MKASRRIVVDGVDTDAMFRFPHILSETFHALQPPRLVLGLFAVVVIMTLGGLFDAVTRPAALPAGLLSTHDSDLDPGEIDRLVRLRLAVHGLGEDAEAHEGDFDVPGAMVWLDRIATRERAGRTGWSPQQHARYVAARTDLKARRPVGRFAGTMVDVGSELRLLSGSVLRAEGLGAAMAMRRLLLDLPARNWRESRVFVVYMLCVIVAVWAVVGGAIARIAACDLAGGERIGVRDGMAFGVRRAGLLFAALLLPVGLLAALVALMFIPALILGIPWLGIIVGLLWFLALIAGLFAAFLLVVGVPAAPMLVPVVVCEHCDPVDALQRVFACVLRRPLHLAAYAALWLIGLAVGLVVVGLFVEIAVRLPAMLAGNFSRAIMTTSSDAGVLMLTEPGSFGRTPAVGLASFWSGVVLLAVPAWCFSYLAGGWTAIYLVLRRASEGRDLDEIWRAGMISGTQVPVAVDKQAKAEAGP